MSALTTSPAPAPFTRRADPWKDLSVIDARGPRFNQTVVAVGSVLALVTGAWPLLGLLGLRLAVSVRFGRRYCLPCVFYFEVLQPRLGEGPLEDSRAPRFANIIGAVVLSSATLAYVVGFPRVGFGLGLVVAGLATLAATTGLCVGCELYRVLAWARGIKGGRLERVDLEALGVTSASPEVVVLFTHPLCSDCQVAGPKLEAAGHRVVKVDISKDRALARKYGVDLVPLAWRVGADGVVLGRVD
jgi:hypothetical protein